MDDEQIKSMDAFILLSIINMKLRDFYSNLEVLCEDMDISQNVLVDKLLSVGYEYQQENNQFIR
ncbi:DUF4250 domain-containing protein [Clostridium folliculivorans]|uniref:DUF4250 domain-containing protein n=1 Tax=Clostridium folliculivorans TaxID=2886038 RepID=A0A9W5Y347_9CLOT|nr:DUF4250 domain-containing protein [Clostridium folliculivorans]GKU25738.1 DUF4250 domain-containing protein [Clostridium folliculivorans]GKU28760.1 DUF4250 domain-containing protein [Clostridium folliculivorans]